MTGSFPLSAQQAWLIGRERALGHTLLAGILIDLPAGPAPDTVRQAVTALVHRHEILRTRYVSVAGLKLPLQSVEPAPDVTFVAADGELALPTLLELARQPLDSAIGPLVAAILLPSRLLLAVPRHSVDEASLALLARDVQALLAGTAVEVGDALQYADYALWQAELPESEVGRQGQAFWRGLIETHSSVPVLPLERQADGATTQVTATINDLAPRLAVVARQLDTSDDRLLFLLWSAFVGRLAGVERLLGGLTIDGRNEDLLATVGPFARTLPVAVDLRQDLTLATAWAAFRESLERSLSWQDCLSEPDLVDATGQLRLAHTFTYEATPPAADRVWIEGAGEKRLHLTYSGAQSARLTLSHVESAFPKAMAAIWLEQLKAFLSRVLDGPDQPLGAVPMLSDSEREKILRSFNDAPPLIPVGLLLHERFEQQVDADPVRPALRLGDRTLSYGELEARANAVANTLRVAELQPGQVVGVHGNRAVETVVAILGILKAGGAYLPLDPAYPPQRLALMVRDTGTRHILALAALPDDVVPNGDVTVHMLGPDASIWQAAPERPAADVRPESLAYLVYTSGSTGQPKGVMVSHANATASLAARLAFYAEPVRVFLLLSPFSFDSSVAGLFWTLSQGGLLVLPEEEEHRDPERLASRIAEAGVSHYLALPSLHAQLMELVQEQGLACAIVAGEACPPDLPRRHAAKLPSTALVNEYGPTEGSVWCTAWRADQALEDETVAIGRPIPGARVHILDADLEPVPIGMEGEIHLAGAGVARGYHGRLGLTAERFVPDPYDTAGGGRLYRTGDRGRYRPDGVIEYRGRVDQQVKVRGFRIEPAEIEAAIARCAGVTEAAVIARDTPAGKELVGFVAGAGGGALLDRVRERLAATLPAHMLPARLRLLDACPRTPSGKLDRTALPALDKRGRDYVAPRTELERKLAGIWADALAVERVGAHDSFFELGGHSLLAAKLRSRIRDELDVVLPLRFFFEGETLEQFATKVAAQREAAAGAARLDALESMIREAEAG